MLFRLTEDYVAIVAITEQFSQLLFCLDLQVGGVAFW